MADNEARALQARLDAAERACLMFGWTAARHESDRDKAAHELWSDWWDRYGSDAQERHGAELSDEHIAELARKRDETRRHAGPIRTAGDLMAKYAATTTVSVQQRRGEIEHTLNRYGATAFGYATDGARAQVVFEMNGRRMRLDVALPDRESHEFTRLPKQPWRERSVTEAESRYQQAVRQRWAALALWIKAQCEAIDSEVVTAEQAFLGWVVLPDGQTLGEKLHPQLDEVYGSGDMPALLPGNTR